MTSAATTRSPTHATPTTGSTGELDHVCYLKAAHIVTDCFGVSLSRNNNIFWKCC